jgi:uncharacterized protein YbbK (DUF523 family)
VISDPASPARQVVKLPLRRVLVSACLLGERVRYDGTVKPVREAILARWISEGRVIPVCPEVAGGLPVPRPPVELQPDHRLLDLEGADRSAEFIRGAAEALRLAQAGEVAFAVLKESSPSCGPSLIHDGSFQGRQIPGAGLTARALRAAGFQVFSEAQLEDADALLCRLDRPSLK